MRDEQRVREIVREEMAKATSRSGSLQLEPASDKEITLSERVLIWDVAVRLHPIDDGVETFAITLEALRVVYLAFRSREGLS